MQEVGVIINMDGDAIYWHSPENRTSVALPDSRTLWTEMWGRRDEMGGFAHSHPGSGIPGPSHEDITTFAATEAGLGKRFKWWITSSDRMVVCQWEGPEKYNYYVYEIQQSLEPSWVYELRKRSDSL